MKRIQFSIRGLMVLVIAAPLLIMVGRYAIRHGDHGEFVGATVLALVVAFAVPIYRGGRTRSFCNGFVLAGLAYFLLSLTYGMPRAGYSGDVWATTHFYRWVFDTVAPDPAYHPLRNVGFAEDEWKRPSVEERRNLFLLNAHALTSLVVGGLGGFAAVALLRRREERLRRVEERADGLIASDAQDEPIQKLRWPR